MKLGVNSDVNIEQKPVGIKHNLGTSKPKLSSGSQVSQVKHTQASQESQASLTGIKVNQVKHTRAGS